MIWHTRKRCLTMFSVKCMYLDHHCHPPELDADEELRHDDEDEDPGLPPQLGAVRVIQQLKGLPQT